jgi:hypothetical protein
VTRFLELIARIRTIETHKQVLVFGMFLTAWAEVLAFTYSANKGGGFGSIIAGAFQAIYVADAKGMVAGMAVILTLFVVLGALAVLWIKILCSGWFEVVLGMCTRNIFIFIMTIWITLPFGLFFPPLVAWWLTPHIMWSTLEILHQIPALSFDVSRVEFWSVIIGY